jgi:hypothetical protein
VETAGDRAARPETEATMSEFDKLKDDAEQEAKDHPQQVHEGEQDAEHALESKFDPNGAQQQGDQQDQGSQQGQGGQGQGDQPGQDGQDQRADGNQDASQQQGQ